MVELGKATGQSFGRPRMLLAKIGDSRASGEVLSNTPSFGRTLQNASAWIEFCSYGRVRAPVSYNKAAGGTGVGDLVTQLDNVIALSPRPTHVWMPSGTNEINNAASATGLVVTMAAEFVAAWTKALNAGIIPIQPLDFPRQWTASTLTVAVKRSLHNEINQWLRLNAEAYGAILIDANWLLTDTSNANGECLTSLYLVETPAIHPSLGGGLLIGNKVRDVLAELGLPPRYVGIGKGDVYDATNNPRGNLLSEGGCLFSNGGTKGGSNPPTGDVPTGLILRNDTGSANLTSCVGSLEARADGPGNLFKVVATASGACRILIYGSGSTYNCNIGDVLEYGVDLIMESSSGLGQVSVSLEDRTAAGAAVNTAQYGFQHGTVATVGAVPSAFAGRVICPQLTLGASFANLRFAHIVEFSGAGAATFYLGAPELRKVVA